MKNLFGIYESGESAYTPFIVRRLSQSKSRKLDEAMKTSEALDKKRRAPAWMSYVYVPAVIIGVMIIISFIIAPNGFEHAYKTRWYLFYAAALVFCLGVFCRVYMFVKNRKAKADPEADKFIAETEKLAKSCYFELGVPEGALEVDVIMPYVKIDKNGEERVRGDLTDSFINYPFKAFTEGENVCFADAAMVIALPKTSFTEVVTVDKKIYLKDWNKSLPPDDQKYKDFEIKLNGFGVVAVRPYYSVRLTDGDKTFEMFIPCYDIDAVKSLIGIS